MHRIRKIIHLLFQGSGIRASHNGFPDLIYFKKQFYCAIREGNSHRPDKSGRVKIIRSKDGVEWKSVALLELADMDVQEAALSESKLEVAR